MMFAPNPLLVKKGGTLLKLLAILLMILRCFKLSDVLFIMLIKIKMPTTVGTLTFMSIIIFYAISNFINIFNYFIYFMTIYVFWPRHYSIIVFD